MSLRWSSVLALVSGCGGGATSGAPVAPPADVVRPASPGPVPAPASEGDSGARFVPLAIAPPLPGVALGIESPRAGDVLPAAQARSTAVRVSLSGAPPSTAGRIGLVLDDDRVRYVDGQTAELVLGDLVSADRALGAGGHRLSALLIRLDGDLARDGSGAAIASTVRFSVGEAVAEPPLADIVYLEPQGTFNGVEAARGARLLCAVSGVRPDEHELWATIVGARGRTSARVDASRAYAIEALESGDYRVSLELRDKRSDPVAKVGRTITVNLDAPLGK